MHNCPQRQPRRWLRITPELTQRAETIAAAAAASALIIAIGACGSETLTEAEASAEKSAEAVPAWDGFALEGGERAPCPDEPSEALIHDATVWAETQGISVEEAVHRACLQDYFEAVSDPIRDLAPERFGGSWLHQSADDYGTRAEFGMVIAFTGDELPDGIEPLVENAIMPVAIRLGAPRTEEVGYQMAEDHSDLVFTHPDAVGFSYSITTGEFTIMMLVDPDSDEWEDEAALIERLRSELSDDLPDEIKQARIELTDDPGVLQGDGSSTGAGRAG